MISSPHLPIAVPGVVETPVAMLTIHEKTGPIYFSFKGIPEIGFDGHVKPNPAVLTFKFYESNDGATWGSALGSGVVLTPGAQRGSTVLTTKRYLRITGEGDVGGGKAILDVSMNGKPYHGQVAVDVYPAKTGFGKDGTSPAAEGAAVLGSSAWPE